MTIPNNIRTTTFIGTGYVGGPTMAVIKEHVHIHNNANSGMHEAHAIAILTEWDEFKDYDWEAVFENMLKPAFVFDGRNILDASKMNEIGFEYNGIGKG